MQKLTFLFLFSSICTLAQPNRGETGYDRTDGAMKEKFYVWGERQDLTKMNAMRSNADVWYMKQTTANPGYVQLLSGEYLDGSLIRRKTYNKASFTQIAVEGGGKKDDPAGVSYYEVIMVVGQDTSIHKMENIAYYGLHYSVNDYEPKSFRGGLVYLKDGRLLEGYVRTIYYQSPYETLKYYGKVYFASSNTEDVQLFQSDEVEKVFSLDEDGKSREFYRLDDWLVDLDQFKSSFSDRAGENKFEPFLPGTVYMQSGEEFTGKVALDKGKKKVNAFFINKEENLLKNVNAAGLSCVKVQTDEGTVIYVPQDGQLMSYNDLIKKWEKKGEVIPGKIVFENGTEVAGKVVLGRDNSNLVKSYQNIVNVFLIPESADGFVQLFEANENVNYVEATEKGGQTKYVPVNGAFVDYKDFVMALENNNSKNPTENLQPGYIMLKDGTKKEGKIAGGRFKISFIGSGNSLSQYAATDVAAVDYYIQTIDGVDRKFVPMRRKPNNAGIIAASHEFVEIIAHSETYSYYKNPYPTHVREGLSNFAGGLAEAAANELSEELAEAAARAAIKETYNSSGDLGKSLEAGGKAANESLEVTQGMVNGDELAICFEEWVIVNNKTKEKTVVYVKNDEQVMSELLKKCAKSASLKEKELKSLRKIDNLPAFIQFMNACN